MDARMMFHSEMRGVGKALDLGETLDVGEAKTSTTID